MSVPKGVEALLPYLRKDRALRESLFRNMKATLFGGATMPAHIFNEFESLAVVTTGVRITNVGINGFTEAGPCALMANWHVGDQPLIGAPAPGMEAKIVSCGNKFEVRLRRPAVMPAYWRDPERTAAAFDEEGFFRIGDAVAPVDTQRWGDGSDIQRSCGRGFQAHIRNVGQCGRTARSPDRPFRAVYPRRRHRRARSRTCGRHHVSRY